MCKQYVSDIINSDEIKNWEESGITDILINTPTASGKSTFILNTLYNYAKDNGKRILMLVHRTRTLNQFKDDMIKYKNINSDILALMSYQSIEDYFMKNHNNKNLDSYDYIICDEVHYWFGDSAFSTTCDLSLSNIITTNATRIYMSATIGVLLSMLEDEYDITPVVYNEIKTDYSYINKFNFFKKDETIYNLIDDMLVDTDEKVLLFCNNTKKIEKLLDKYGEVATLCVSENNILADKMNKDEIRFMEQNEYFNKRILIATSALDCGFTIKDHSLKNMIITNVSDLDQLKQMVGRKRLIDEEDYLNLYIQNVGGETLGGIYTRENIIIETVEDFRKLGETEFIKSSKYFKKSSKVVYLDVNEFDTKVLKENIPMYYNAIRLKLQCELMNIGKADGYAKIVTEILGQGEFSKSMFIEEKEQMDELEIYLLSIVGKRLHKEEQKELIEKLDLRINGRILKSVSSLNSALIEKFNMSLNSKRVKEKGKLETIWILSEI